jgi:hypothetical protein
VISIAIAVVLSAGEPVPINGGVSPDERYEVVLEADHDSPRFLEYEFKGGEEQFPALLVVHRGSRGILGRFPWPGAATETESRLRDRTQVKWRSDSAAVAINTRDRFYAQTLVLAHHAESGRFAAVAIPPYAELTGRPMPPDHKLRSRGREISIGWTDEGRLVLETWLWGEVDYPLSYRLSLRLAGGRFVVHDREPILEGTPSW